MVRSKIWKVVDLDTNVIENMYQLYSSYYGGANRSLFLRDLQKKDQVIILGDTEGKVLGFTTIVTLKTLFEGERVCAIFSGDTIVHHDYWGKNDLAQEWIKLAGQIKYANPTLPLYWFLIVKGHRTYRYLSVFSQEYFPAPGVETTPYAQRLMDHLADQMFGPYYDKERGILSFQESQGHLHEDWAKIPEKDLKLAEVKFFLEKNPGYKKGDELVCLCELSEENLKPLSRRLFNVHKTDVVPLKSLLDLEHHGKNEKLNRILDAYLKIQGRQKNFQEKNYYWGPEHYGLHLSSLFLKASIEQQSAILSKCSQNLIAESYFIEKSASAYCAKMMLLAKSIEVAQTYSMIANEEAIHLEWISPYMPVEKRHNPEGPFLQFLSSLIETCEPNLLAYLVQVILEGWGVHHYKDLARNCIDPSLKSIFLDIVRDEALHHHTGIVVFDPECVTYSEQLFIEDCLKTYAKMVKAGPIALLSAIAEVLGELSKEDKSLLLEEIEADQEIQKKLNLLKKLMLQPEMEKIVQKLEDEGYFSIKCEV